MAIKNILKTRQKKAVPVLYHKSLHLRKIYLQHFFSTEDKTSYTNYFSVLELQTILFERFSLKNILPGVIVPIFCARPSPRTRRSLHSAYIKLFIIKTYDLLWKTFSSYLNITYSPTFLTTS